MTPSSPVLAPEAVDAITVRSFQDCEGSPELAWDAINAGWAELGDTQVHIDYSYEPACHGPITYDALVARGADVLILSDTAGAGNRLRAGEIEAIEQYVADGHGILATFLLRYRSTNNGELKPTLGIDTRLGERAQPITPTYRMRVPDHPLFARIPSGFYPTSFAFGQSLADGLWQRRDRVRSAVFVGKAKRTAAILVQDGPPARTVYISSMPEYQSNAEDIQFLYNAITWVSP